VHDSTLISPLTMYLVSLLLAKH